MNSISKRGDWATIASFVIGGKDPWRVLVQLSSYQPYRIENDDHEITKKTEPNIIINMRLFHGQQPTKRGFTLQGAEIEWFMQNFRGMHPIPEFCNGDKRSEVIVDKNMLVLSKFLACPDDDKLRSSIRLNLDEVRKLGAVIHALRIIFKPTAREDKAMAKALMAKVCEYVTATIEDVKNRPDVLCQEIFAKFREGATLLLLSNKTTSTFCSIEMVEQTFWELNNADFINEINGNYGWLTEFVSTLGLNIAQDKHLLNFLSGKRN